MRKQTLHPRTAAINQKQKNQSKKSRREALLWLAGAFPQAFDNNVRIRPLKLGIMNDILLHADAALQAGFSKSKLREAVVLFTRRLDYLACLKAREMRVDLDGNAVDAVSDEDAERAALKIKKRIEKNIKNLRKMTVTQPTKPYAPKSNHYSSPEPSYLKTGVAHTSERIAYQSSTNVQSPSRTASVIVKHKTTRQYDPSAVARLKEKLGLSARQTTEDVES